MTQSRPAMYSAGAALCVAATVALTLPDTVAACRHQGHSALPPSIPLMTLTPLPCPEDITSSGSHGFEQPTTAAERLSQFLAAGFDNVTADLVRGSDEYLFSLASLLGVPSMRQDEFIVQLRAATLAQPDALVSQERLLQLGQEQRLLYRARE